MHTISERIKDGMEIKGLRQVDLVKMTGISKGAISSYLSGKFVPKQRKLFQIARALDVDEGWLMGHDVPMNQKKEPSQPISVNGLVEFTKEITLPLVNYATSKHSAASQESNTEFVTVPNFINADYCLRFKGDSMINADIYDGDMVYIKDGPVNNGEIVAVILNNEATLKRIYKNKDNVSLNPENPAFEPIILTKDDFDKIKVLGKAVAFISRIK